MDLAMLSLLLFVPFLTAVADSTVEGPHASNSVFRALVDAGFEIEGRRFVFPPPLLRDGQTAEAQKEVLRGLLGSDRKVEEFLRDWVSAPHILKLKDEATTGNIVRRAHLWFAGPARLDDIGLDALPGPSAEAKPV